MDRELADNGFAATGRGCTKTLCPAQRNSHACTGMGQAQIRSCSRKRQLSLRSGIAALSLRIFRQAIGLFLPIIHT